MITDIWRIQPVHATILEILREKGSMSDEKLFEILKVFYKGIGSDNFNNTLMRMEVSCLISVSSLLKNKRLIQLIKT
jgi:hypothetical protein